jgi:hypothetical protein
MAWKMFFGKDKAALLVRNLGLKRMLSDEELKPAAFLYAVILLEPHMKAGRMDDIKSPWFDHTAERSTAAS